MDDIYIGVDGGGSKTTVIVADHIGNQLGVAISGPANISTSVDLAWQSILDGIEQALTGGNIDINSTTRRIHVGLGLAGTEVPEAKAAFLSRKHPFSTFLLESDAHVACLGVHNQSKGAVIIIGTGVIGYQILNNQHWKVSGWGFPHSDRGGGAWLGMRAIRVTLDYFDGRASKTPLLDDVYNHFDQDILKMVTWANRARTADYATLAPIVVNAVHENDPHAIELMEKAAIEVHSIADTLDKKVRDSDIALPYCLLGGISKHVLPFIEPKLKDRLVERQNGPEVGALIMLKSYLAYEQTGDQGDS